MEILQFFSWNSFIVRARESKVSYNERQKDNTFLNFQATVITTKYYKFFSACSSENGCTGIKRMILSPNQQNYMMAATKKN